MNCPGCGRFMALYFAHELGMPISDAAFWWACTNDFNCHEAWKGSPIAAPEYDFIYWYQDIPSADLDADKGLKAEYRQMRQKYLNRRMSHTDNRCSRLEYVCRQLIEYRNRAGALNFQLEKADDYLRQIELILAENGETRQ